MIRADQQKTLAEKDLNLSGLVRDLLDDFLSDHKVTLSVSDTTARLYGQIVSNTGATDADVEPYLRQALRDMLRDRIQKMEELERKEFGESKKTQ